MLWWYHKRYYFEGVLGVILIDSVLKSHHIED